MLKAYITIFTSQIQGIKRNIKFLDSGNEKQRLGRIMCNKSEDDKELLKDDEIKEGKLNYLTKLLSGDPLRIQVVD